MLTSVCPFRSLRDYLWFTSGPFRGTQHINTIRCGACSVNFHARNALTMLASTTDLCGAHTCSPQLIKLYCYVVTCINQIISLLCVCSPECQWENINITIPSCQLERNTNYKPIRTRSAGGKIYQISSPQFFVYSDYPNNTYCAWNVADTGNVTYRIIDQRLQEPSDCNRSGCACPDSVKITMEANEIMLCGGKLPPISNQISSNGLQVRFCSDNKQSARGFLIMAYLHGKCIM